MVAYVYSGPGLLNIQRVPRPSAGPREAVLQVTVASICGTDIRTRRHGNPGLKPPRILGHESTGTLVEVGAAVEGFREGDRVLLAPAMGCGTCPSCRRGRTNMCSDLQTIGFEYDGTFAEYLRIPERAFRMGNVLHLSPEISDEEATLAEPAACCLNGQSFLGIGQGDVVLIIGSGFIGCVHAELALQSGAARVIMSDVSDRRLAAARRALPAVEAVNPQSTDLVRHVRDTTDGFGADVIITANAVGATHTTAMEVAARRGRISLFGGLPEPSGGFLDSNAIHYKELAVYGSHASTVAENARILAMIAAGNLKLSRYASRRYPLERIEDGFEALRSEDVLKVILAP